MKKLVFILSFFFSMSFVSSWSGYIYAQNQHHIDSLENVLKNHHAKKLELNLKPLSLFDSTEADCLFELSRCYIGIYPEKALNYANQSLAISEQIKYKKGIGNAYNNIGVLYSNQGNYSDALKNHNAALKIREEIEDKKGMAGSYNNIGLIYSEQGNYINALEKYIAALKINEALGNKKWVAKNYANIGNLYTAQGNYALALEYLLKALKINEESGEVSSIINNYSNIGIIYTDQGKYSEALKFQLKSLEMAKKSGHKLSMAGAYINIGENYLFQGNYAEALINSMAALKIFEEVGSNNGIAYSCNNIGKIYINQKKYKNASEFLKRGLLLSKEIGAMEMIRNSYQYLAILDSIQANFKQAFEHYKQFIIYRDSLVNIEYTKKTVALQMTYDFSKKQDSLNAAQEKKDAIAKTEKQKSTQQKVVLIIGLIAALGFAAWDYRQKKIISKQKKRSDELLLNILPHEVAEELKAKGSAEAQLFDEVTVLFTDFKGFTQLSEKLTPKELVAEINECFSAFDYIMQKFGVEKIKTIGDAYMAAGGLPTANTTHAEDVVKAALEIQTFMQEHKEKKLLANELFFEIRIGVHTGPVVAGIVGVKKFAYDIWGDTVNTASRMESSGEVGKVNISGTTYELVKDKFTCVHRGKVQAKGKGEIDMYFVSKI